MRDAWGSAPAGSAMAAVGFSLCGFQAVHAVHEPFYHLMPYLPLCLLLADRYAATGRPAWLAGLAMRLGHAGHARALPDPDVDGGPGAPGRRVAGAGSRRVHGSRGPDRRPGGRGGSSG